MKKLFLGVAFMCVIATLCGFSSKFSIKVLQPANQPPSFELVANKLSPSQLSVRINTFLVVKKDSAGKWDYRHPVWSFKVRPGTGIELSKVIYGQVPKGFVEVSKAVVLSSGVKYLAVGLGMGSDGAAEFTAK